MLRDSTHTDEIWRHPGGDELAKKLNGGNWQAWDPVTYPSRRHSNDQAQGPARLPGNQARPSEKCDPLSLSRWAKFQPNDDAQGQPGCEDITPLPVVAGVETGDAFAEGHLLVCVSTSGVCSLPQASSCMVSSVSVWSS